VGSVSLGVFPFTIPRLDDGWYSVVGRVYVYVVILFRIAVVVVAV
jgi:hypothetical protein